MQVKNHYDRDDFRTILLEIRVTEQSIDKIGLTPALKTSMQEHIEHLKEKIHEIDEQLEFVDVDLAIADIGSESYQEIKSRKSTLEHKKSVLIGVLIEAKKLLAAE